MAAKKTYATQLLVTFTLRLAQKVQQLATPVPLAAAKDGSSAGDTPTPEYARSPVLGHSGSDDGDPVAVNDTDKDADAETEAETEAENV